MSNIVILAGLVLLAVFAAIAWGFRSGILPGRRRSGERRRVLLEDALKHIFKTERRGGATSIETLGGQMEISRDRAASILSELQEKGMLQARAGELRLGDEARAYALHIIRAHRLWERYLADRTGLAEVDWHGRAETLEHSLTPDEADRLAAELGNPTHDPHGDPVPGASGDLRTLTGEPLQSLSEGEHARILHVEDEPEGVYRSLLEKGLYPGMEFELVQRSQKGLLLRSEGKQRRIDFVEAGNITVGRLPAQQGLPGGNGRPLHRLKPGEKARVLLVSRAARSVERRRFMDLGILPGAVIETELTGPAADPNAYRIRGTLIALRREQAENILVEVIQEGAA